MVSVFCSRGWGYFDSGCRNSRDLSEDFFGFRGREEIAKSIHGQSERICGAMLNGDEESKGEGDVEDSCRCR